MSRSGSLRNGSNLSSHHSLPGQKPLAATSGGSTETLPRLWFWFLFPRVCLSKEIVPFVITLVCGKCPKFHIPGRAYYGRSACSFTGLVPICAPAQVASGGLVDGGCHTRKIGGHVVLETVFTDESQQFL